MAMVKDPVCGMMVDDKKTKIKAETHGQTFYFCSEACKQAFVKDPHKYMGEHSH